MRNAQKQDRADRALTEEEIKLQKSIHLRMLIDKKYDLEDQLAIVEEQIEELKVEGVKPDERNPRDYNAEDWKEFLTNLKED